MLVALRKGLWPQHSPCRDGRQGPMQLAISVPGTCGRSIGLQTGSEWRFIRVVSKIRHGMALYHGARIICAKTAPDLVL